MKKASPSKSRNPRSRQGFTLLELVVAEAIFLILLALILQLVFGIMQAAQEQKKSMESLGEARQSLDRIHLDWMSRVRRNDVTATFVKADGSKGSNDQFGFLTQVQAYSGDRHLAWVSYQISTVKQVTGGSKENLTSALERSITGYSWGSTPSLTFPMVAPTNYSNDLEPLASTVFRMEYCFLQQTASSTTSPFTVGNTFNMTNNGLNLTTSSLVGVVVTVAALDQQSRQVLTPDQLLSLSDALPHVTTDGQDPQSLWLSKINDGTFASTAIAAGIPKSAVGAVRVFQRILYVKE